MQQIYSRRSRQGWPLAMALLATALTAGRAFGHTTLVGKVVGPTGAPVAGAYIAAYDADNYIFADRTADDGTYELDVVVSTFSITAIAPGFKETTLTNVQSVDDQHTEVPDLKLEVAPPLAIVKATAPIPLTDGIDSPAFASAAEIRLDQGYQVVLGLVDPHDWGGPKMVSGRFKVKWDDANLYVAGDVTFPKLHVNSHTDGNVWQGNAVELYLQNDPYDPNRTAYNPDHNWQLVVGDGPTPAWWLFGAVQAAPKASLADNLAITDKPTKDGVFLRLNVPWSILRKANGDGSAAPANESLGALGIAINSADLSSDPSSTTRKFQLMFPMSSTNDTNPSGLRQVVFTAKAP
jgi:Carboxypeptidase regulatory-like domain/Carbohydrate family 9 binding domain-like